jgi:hypothetical protein
MIRELEWENWEHFLWKKNIKQKLVHWCPLMLNIVGKSNNVVKAPQHSANMISIKTRKYIESNLRKAIAVYYNSFSCIMRLPKHQRNDNAISLWKFPLIFHSENRINALLLWNISKQRDFIVSRKSFYCYCASISKHEYQTSAYVKRSCSEISSANAFYAKVFAAITRTMKLTARRRN